MPFGSVAKYDIGVNVAIQGNASAEIAHSIIRGGRIGVILGCSVPGARSTRNDVRGAAESGINIDMCEIDERVLPGSTFNSVHHNTVFGGLMPYSIAVGDGSDFNAIHQNAARWISVCDANLVHNNTAQLFNIVAGGPPNAAFNDTVAGVCP